MTFIPDEVLEIAEFMERNGAKFYRTAAEDASGEIRNLLLSLAEMEEDHEKTFRGMRSALSPEEKILSV